MRYLLAQNRIRYLVRGRDKLFGAKYIWSKEGIKYLVDEIFGGRRRILREAIKSPLLVERLTPNTFGGNIL